jgi:putative MATE family efflux protein
MDGAATPTSAKAAPPSRQHGHRLTEGPITPTLFWFSLPILGSNVLQSLNGSINAIWVGRFIGEAGITATANANLVLFFLLGAVFGVGMAGTIMVGQAMGAKNLDGAKRVVGTSATFFGAVSLAVAVFGYVMSPTILGWFGTPTDAFAMAVTYLRIIFVALPALYLNNYTMMILRGAGDARTPLIFMFVSVVLDAGLNPFFINGWGPFPRMGIAGSATSTLIGQTVSMFGVLIYLYARRHPLRLVGEELGYLKPDLQILRTTIVKGLPMGLQMIVISGSAIAVMGMVNAYGTMTAAAYGVGAQIWTYIQMPAMAIGAAASSMAAQNVGAQQWRRVELTARSGAIINFFLTGALVALVLFAERPLLELFLPGHPDAIAIASHINRIVAWSFILFGLTFVLFGVVRSTGAVMPPLISLAISLLGVRLAFAKLLEPYWGADALWWSFPASMAVSAALAFGYYRWGGWRKARMGPPVRASGEADATGFATPAMDAMCPEAVEGD